jgi:hypothetical protein
MRYEERRSTRIRDGSQSECSAAMKGVSKGSSLPERWKARHNLYDKPDPLPWISQFAAMMKGS